MCSEIEHNLAEDVDQGVLVKLTDFLNLPEVRAMNVTKATADSLVVPRSIHLVANPASKSSPIRLVVAPNRPEATTKQSVNSALHSGLPQLPKLQEILLKVKIMVVRKLLVRMFEVGTFEVRTLES